MRTLMAPAGRQFSPLSAFPRTRSNWCGENVTFPHMYRDGFAQGIVGRQPGGHVLAHAPHNNTMEGVPSCPRKDGCYTIHTRWRNKTLAITWYPVWRNSRDRFLRCVSVPRLYKKVPSITSWQLAEGAIGGKRQPREIRSWRSQPVKT
jgi:hypothetical protein